MMSEVEVDVWVGEFIYVVLIYVICIEDGVEYDFLFLVDFVDYLGVSCGLVNMIDRFFISLCVVNYEVIEVVEFCVIGRGVE